MTPDSGASGVPSGGSCISQSVRIAGPNRLNNGRNQVSGSQAWEADNHQWTINKCLAMKCDEFLVLPTPFPRKIMPIIMLVVASHENVAPLACWRSSFRIPMEEPFLGLWLRNR